MNLTDCHRPQGPIRRPNWRWTPALPIAALATALALGPRPAPAAEPEPDVRRDATVIAIEKVLPSVVNIATESVIEYHEPYDELLRQFYGWAQTPVRREKSISLGSGVIIDKEGYILTNFHVVRRASRIQVKLSDGREFDADPIVATQASDIALLKLRAKPGDTFTAIRLAADDDLLLGETVLALGNPYGLGDSVTRGILSSKNRRPSTGNEPLDVEDWLQTDAAINPGNSGGPLVNLRGELIGINVAVKTAESGEQGMGIGFSIPVKQVSAALSKFFTPELTDSLWFGVQVKTAPGTLLVASVQPGSPGAAAGLRPGDHLLQVNGQPAPNLVVYNRLLGAAPAHRATLLVERAGGQRVKLHATLLPFDELIRRKLGLSLVEITSQTAERLGFRAGEALFVEKVEPASPAADAQIERGFLLRAVDGQPAGKLRDVSRILTAKSTGAKVSLTLIIPRALGGSYVEFRQGSVDVPVR